MLDSMVYYLISEVQFHNCEGFKEAKSIKRLCILSLHSVQNEGVISIVRYGFCGD